LDCAYCDHLKSIYTDQHRICKTQHLKKKQKVLTVLADTGVKFLRKNGFNRFSVIYPFYLTLNPLIFLKKMHITTDFFVLNFNNL
jgi:hypothetical protein